MQELQSGVELKRVDPGLRNKPCLTSHELLMREIRNKMVVLKPPVMTPQPERAARDQMMDYIKSQPRLKSVMERKLPRTPRKQETPVEKLLSDIRGSKARQSLRRASTRTRLNTSSLVKNLERLTASEAKRGLRTIEPEPEFQTSVYNFEESPDTSFEEDSVFGNSGKEAIEDHKKSSRKIDVIEDDNDVVPVAKSGLTLDELSTIRSKVSKAHLEMKDVSWELKMALDTGRVCFSCEKIKFNLFNWSIQCNICRRSICSGRIGELGKLYFQILFRMLCQDEASSWTLGRYQRLVTVLAPERD